MSVLKLRVLRWIVARELERGDSEEGRDLMESLEAEIETEERESEIRDMYLENLSRKASGEVDEENLPIVEGRPLKEKERRRERRRREEGS